MAGEIFTNREFADTTNSRSLNIDEAEAISGDIERILELLARRKPKAAINALMTCCYRWRWSSMWPHFVYCARTSAVFDFLSLDPISAYAIANPDSSVYAAPALDHMLDYGYVRQANSDAATIIAEAVWGCDIGKSIRNRRSYFAAFLTMCMDDTILVVDAGRMRELELLAKPPAQLTVGDNQPENVTELRDRYPTLRVVNTNIFGAIEDDSSDLGLSRSPIYTAKLVYTPLSLDALSDEDVLRQMRTLWELTAPGGSLILASTAPYSTASSYFDLLFDRPLMGRGEREIRSLWGLAFPDSSDKLEIFRDSEESNIFLRIAKPVTSERTPFELVNRGNSTSRLNIQAPDPEIFSS